MKPATSMKARRLENQKLSDRLIKFSLELIELSGKLPKTLANLKILDQVIPSGTSIGANYNEACEAESSKDFVHKIKICIKEAKETKYWLILLGSIKGNYLCFNKLNGLANESEEFIRIFSSIISKFRK